MKKIYLPIFGSDYYIKLEINEDGAGTICSTLHLKLKSICPRCRKVDCCAFDALESLILAHACLGVNVESECYVEGIRNAVDAIVNNSE